jgi:hypothetical protein
MHRRISVEAAPSAQAGENGDKDDPVGRVTISTHDAVAARASLIRCAQRTVDAIRRGIVLHPVPFRDPVMAKRHVGRSDAMTYGRHE